MLTFHKFPFPFQNPGICTTLPEEIKLFYDLSSIDMEEFDISLDQLKEELASRMSLCQLSSIEEFNVCMTYSLGEFKLDKLRFDQLSLAGDCERSSGEGDDKSDIKNKTLKRKHEEVTKMEENELEIISDVKRKRLCESENEKGMSAAIKPKIILDSSSSDTFPYDYDPSEGCIIGKSISREDFTSKHKYITAWAECQSETCLNRNPANSASSISGEDMDLEEISVEEKFSDNLCETKSCIASESQLASHDVEGSADLGNLKVTQLLSEKQSTEVELLSNEVYIDCFDSCVSDHVKQLTQPINDETNKGLERTQNESNGNLTSELKCHDKMSSDIKVIDSDNKTQVTQSCNDEPPKELCRASNEILPETSKKLSGATNSNKGHKISKRERKSKFHSELKYDDKVSSQSNINNVDSNNTTRVTQDFNDKPKTEACRASKEILPERESNKDSGEANSNKCLKIAQHKSDSNLNLELKCCDKVSSQSNVNKVKNEVDSQNTTRVTQGCIDQPNVKACQFSNEILPDKNNINLSGETEGRPSLKITLVHKGSGIWAVKTSNKRKRSESESDNCIDKLNDAQAILEESAKQRCKVLKRVKLALTNDRPSKKVKQGPVHTTKFKSLRRLATNLCEMKSRIFRKPFQKKRATVTPLLI